MVSLGLLISVSLGINFNDLILQQQQSDEIHPTLTAVTSMHLADVVVTQGRPSLLCELSSGTPHPVIPPGTQCQVFDLLHGLSHFGVSAS